MKREEKSSEGNLFIKEKLLIQILAAELVQYRTHSQPRLQSTSLLAVFSIPLQIASTIGIGNERGMLA